MMRRLEEKEDNWKEAMVSEPSNLSELCEMTRRLT
jgi:hypothetical protein